MRPYLPLLLLTLLLTSGCSSQSDPADVALIHGAIYANPTDAPIVDGVVLIRGGRIISVGPRGSIEIARGTETIDCSGMTILAGFWNSHVHFIERKWAAAETASASDLETHLKAMLTRYGVTSAFDTGSDWSNTRALRDRIESGEIAGPRIYSTGNIIFPEGSGAPPLERVSPNTFMAISGPEIADAEQSRVASRRLLEAGTDGIKLYVRPFWMPDISIPEPAIASAAAEAHRRGEPVFAHPTSAAGLLAAVRNGVTVIVHTTADSGPWDSSVPTAMRQRNVALIPTLKLWSYELRNEPPSTREKFQRIGVDQLSAWVASGGAVLFGTDVGYMTDYDPSEEFNRMSQAGMSFGQILASLTTLPAERFGQASEKGQVAAGFLADLTVLSRSPEHDVGAWSDVRYTIRGGRVIYRGSREKE